LLPSSVLIDRDGSQLCPADDSRWVILPGIKMRFSQVYPHLY
jgi:hypothetical protein